MPNLFKFLFFSALIGCSACSPTGIEQKSQVTKSEAIADVVTDNHGLVIRSSPYDVTETTDRLENTLKAKGLTLFTRIDHSANANQAGLELAPTQLLIFGNPKVGTPLMECSATTAIDLPQKILVWQNDDNQTQIAYNMPEYLQQRHNITDCDQVLTKVSGVLKSITEEAIK